MAARDSNLLAEIDRNFLLCGICSERYRNAKILPCLHSFCEPCTNKLAKTSDGSITCPVCRRSHELPNGVSSISSNGFLNDLVDLFAKRESEDGSRNCQACEQEGATTRCIECAFDICQLCASAHTKFPLMKAHRLMSLDDYNVARCSDLTSIQPPVYCSAHREYQIEFFCDTCKEAICLKCTALDHAKPEHRYRCVQEAAGSFMEDLSAIIDKMKEKETETVQSKVAVQHVLDSLDSCFRKETDEVSQQIRQKVEEHTRLIQENGNKLQAELKAEYEKRKFNLTAQLKELDIAENDLKCTCEYVETLLRYGNAPQVTSAKKGVEDQAGELLKLKTRVSPTEDDYMEFVRCDDVCKDWRLGEIICFEKRLKKRTTSRRKRIVMKTTPSRRPQRRW
ncbi:E3 ubiquitin-protein ligase TRIM56-like [Ptychodera flava]|uniref:E3 ubiquitin-protein ligase TRIM56-like n=1 Tax=Ptychodera flava TaxID=63121 RepID=UPI003969F0E4